METSAVLYWAHTIKHFLYYDENKGYIYNYVLKQYDDSWTILSINKNE